MEVRVFFFSSDYFQSIKQLKEVEADTRVQVTTRRCFMRPRLLL